MTGVRRLKSVLFSPSAPRLTDKLALSFCFVTIAFLISGPYIHVNPVRVHALPLSAIDPAEPLISGTTFGPNAVYPTTIRPYLEGRVNFYGSLIGPGAQIGVVHTPWYPARSDAYLFVAGYPNRPGNHLIAEVMTSHSDLIRMPILISGEPGQAWRLNKIFLHQVKYRTKFRIIAEDGSPNFWVGFSQPFLVTRGDYLRLAIQFLLVLAVTVSSIVFFLSPGLILRQKLLQSARHLAFIWIPAPGLLTLVVLGLFAWIGPRALKPDLISSLGLCALSLYALYRFAAQPISSFTTLIERRVLLFTILLVGIAVAKATYSLGPVGELASGAIGRTLEVGDRSDSVISFHTVELVGLRKDPYSALATSLLAPWSNFSDRGPIAGLAASPIVLAGPVQLPGTQPNHPWAVFDPQGFSAYRIAMIVMAVCSLFAIYGVASLFLSDDWALLACLVTVTAPFVIHETYFTWPKLEAAYFVLAAAYLIFRSRYFFAGLSLGIGYLCHPSALVWLSSLLGLLILSTTRFNQSASIRTEIYALALRTVSLCIGLAVCLLFWRAANGAHFTQSGFIAFFFQTGEYLGGGVANWFRSRLDSLCNTLIPLNLFLFHRNNPHVNAIDSSSPPVVQFFFQYWNTLPFGAGIVFFFLGFLRFIYAAFVNARLWLLLVFVFPFVLFAIYLGPFASGLMRDGLQAWFLGLMVFLVVIWNKYLTHSQRFWRICNLGLLFRGVEIIAMLVLPTVSSRQMFTQIQFAPTDVLALATMCAGVAFLCVYTFRLSEKIRLLDAPSHIL